MWKFIFRATLLLTATLAQAQVIPDLVIEEEKPTFAFRSVQINYNALRLIQNSVSDSKASREFQVEVGFHERLFLTADAGFAKTNRGDTYSYQSDGTYWRTGLDINMAKNPDKGNLIGVGLRYAKAVYKDEIAYTRSFLDQNDQTITQDVALENADLSSEWIEFVFKMKVKIWKRFYTGYTMRYQFFLQLDGAESELQPLDIPGYGKTSRPNSFGFDYYIGWRIDL